MILCHVCACHCLNFLLLALFEKRKVSDLVSDFWSTISKTIKTLSHVLGVHLGTVEAYFLHFHLHFLLTSFNSHLFHFFYNLSGLYVCCYAA